MKNVMIFLITGMFFFSGCSQSSYTPYVPLTNDNTDDSTVIQKTILWRPDGNGFTRLYTNEVKYVGDKGWTFMKWGDISDNPMSYVETEVKKVSGDRYTGYGILYCLENSDNFFMLSVDINGNYTIGKRVDGDYFTLKSWGFNEYLVKGYDEVNRLKVTYNGDNNFGFYFNDHHVCDLTDDTVAPPFTGGKFGYICSVSTQDNFPGTPLDVRFKSIYP